MNMGHEKTTVLVYNTLFEGSGIRHSNAELQGTHDMFKAGYFMLLFDLMPDRAASEDHVSLPDQGNIRRTQVRQATSRRRHVPAVSRI